MVVKGVDCKARDHRLRHQRRAGTRPKAGDMNAFHRLRLLPMKSLGLQWVESGHCMCDDQARAAASLSKLLAADCS
jgi:hypothetical protein